MEISQFFVFSATSKVPGSLFSIVSSIQSDLFYLFFTPKEGHFQEKLVMLLLYLLVKAAIDTVQERMRIQLFITLSFLAPVFCLELHGL